MPPIERPSVQLDRTIIQPGSQEQRDAFLPEGSVVVFDPLESINPIPLQATVPAGSTVIFDGGEAQNQNNAAQIVMEAISNDPGSTGSRLATAEIFSQIYGIPVEEIYKNHDFFTEKYLGVKTAPSSSSLKVVQESWSRANLDMDQAELGFQLMLDPNNQDLLDQIEALEEAKPAYDPHDYGFVTQMFADAAGVLPFSMEIMNAGMGAAIPAGAAAGGLLAGIGQLGPQILIPEEVVTVPTAAFAAGVAAFKWGSSVKTMEITSGGIFLDTWRAEDKDGNKVPYPFAIAASLIGGLASSALERLSLDILVTGNSFLGKAIEKASSAALRKMHVTGAITNTAIRFSSNLAGNITTEVMQEFMQENIEMYSSEMSKAMSNQITGSDLPLATKDDYLRMWEEVLSKTARAQMLLSLPGTIGSSLRQGINEFNREQQKAEAPERKIVSDVLAEFRDEDFDATLQIMIDEEKSRTIDKATVQVSDRTVTATSISGEPVGNISFTQNPDEIRISSVTIDDSRIALQSISELQDTFPGRELVFENRTEQLEVVRRAVEDLTPEIRQINTQLDIFRNDLRIAQQHEKDVIEQIKVLKEVPEEGTEAKIQTLNNDLKQTREDIKIRKQGIQDLEEGKIPFQAVSKEAFQQTPEEFQAAVVEPEQARQEFINTPEGQIFRAKIKTALPQFTDDELAASIALIEVRANRLGITPQEWIDQNFAPEVFAPRGSLEGLLGQGDVSRAAVTFLEDGKAVLSVTDRTDFSSWVHELGHIFRKELTGEELATATVWAEDQTGETAVNGQFTVKMEEAFAEGFEDYIFNGNAPNAELQSIFQKFAEFLKAIYDGIRKIKTLSPEIISVFDNLFTDERLQQLSEGTAQPVDPQTLTQPEFQPVPEIGNLLLWATYPKVRGGWTEQKILRELKAVSNKPKGLFNTSKKIVEYTDAKDLLDHTYYHGTSNYIGTTLKPSVVFSDRQIEQIGGGGYGEKQWGISLSKSKRAAEAFSGTSPGVSIYAVLLDKRAKVITIPGVQDAVDLDEHIVQLWTDKVDAVWIGGGEQELVIINPKAIITHNQADYFQVYGGFKSEEFTLEKAQAVMDEAERILAGPRPTKEKPVEGKFLFQSAIDKAQNIKDRAEISGVNLNFTINEKTKIATVNKISVPEENRGEGLATAVMLDITNTADINGYTVALSPTAEFGLSKAKLIDFYKRFGFVENKGKNKDFEISETMYRKPQEVLFQPAAPEESEAFQNFFKDSKVADEAGNPIVMNHGTTHNFEEFTTERANIENDMGKGFYFSSSLDDVDINYAGEGPDLTNRITQLAERVINDMEEDPSGFGFDEDYTPTEDDAEEYARKQLAGDERTIINAYISMQNPAIIGDPEGVVESRETVLEMQEEIIDEEEEEFGEPEGTLIDFSEELRDVAADYDEVGDIEETISGMFAEADYQEILLSKLIPFLKASEGLAYAQDPETGELAVSEIIRQTLENIGFDGIMDFTVYGKFGAGGKGKAMAGINPDTFHAIAFNSEQVKSTENRGSFDPNDPRILFQPEHTAAVQAAVEAGEPVPDRVLLKFQNESWAAEELQKRKEDRQKLGDFPWLADIAKQATSEDDFIEETSIFIGPELDQLSGLSEEFLRDFYKSVGKEDEVLDIEQANQEWLDSWTDEAITDLLELIGINQEQAEQLGIAPGIIASAKRLRAGRGINPKTFDLVRTIFRNNTTLSRERVTRLYGDEEGAQRIEQEKEFSRRIGITPEEDDISVTARISVAAKIDNAKLKAQAESGELTNEAIDKVTKVAKAEVKKLQNKIDKLERSIAEDNYTENVRLQKIQKKFQEKESQIKQLEKDIKKEQKQNAKDKDRSTAKQEALVSARQEAKATQKQTRKELNEVIRDARREAKLERETALKDQRAAQKDRRDAKKLKDYMRKLGKIITRPVPASVDFKYRQMIEAIQAGVDPKFRSKRTLQRIQNSNKFFEENPDAKRLVPQKTLDRLDKISLNDIKVEDLEAIKDQVIHLKQIGKTKKRLRDQFLKSEARGIARQMTLNILGGEDFPEPEVIKGDPRTLPDKIIGAGLKTFRPPRVADMIDGGQNFKGITVEYFIDEVNKIYDTELKSRFKREDAADRKLAELGLKTKDFARQFEVEGLKYTADEAMDVYAGWKNELKRQAIEYGNNIDQSIARQLFDNLTPAEKEFADWIIDEYDEHFDRLNEAFIEYTNSDIGKEENYTPIVRMSWQYEVHENQIADQMLLLSHIQNKGIEKGFGKSRITIPVKYQRAIQLGLYSTWADQIGKQEHYINSAGHVKQMNRVLKDDSLRLAARGKNKTSHINEMQIYVDNYTNPSIYKSQRGLDLIVKRVRNNAALSVLSLNMVTMIKQLPSLAFYTAYSSPQSMLAGIAQTMTNWKDTRAFVEESDPQMRERSVERSIADLRANNKAKYDKIVGKVGRVGMAGIMLFDKIATTIGWISVYNNKIRGGQSHDDAARSAQRATLHTQPAAGFKDVASLYAQDNFLTIFLQFTNQLNQIWNMAIYDAPQAFKDKNYYQGIMTYVGVAMSAALIWMISNRTWKPKPEDIPEMLSDQALNIIPIIGPVIARSAEGWNTGVLVLSPFEAVGKVVGRAKKAYETEELTEEDMEFIFKKMYEAIAIPTGLPTTMTRRVIKAYKEGDPIQQILFGGKINER